jgi:SAM-dependent methyltransferase
MNTKEDLPILYRDLADWWPLLSTPKDYKEEAEFYSLTIKDSCSFVPATLLELGSGGGNNASHMKSHFQLTLVDLSPAMLKVSQQLNPECEHIEGDMRSERLGRNFDSVFVQDAIMYMRSEEDLLQVMETAFVHCKPGGVVLLAPDYTKETFQPSTQHGGHDGEGKSMRYIDWVWDPDKKDSTYISTMVYVMREGADQVTCVHDRHVLGLFSQKDWLRIMIKVGFRAACLPFEHSEVAPGTMHVFLGCKPD